MSQIAIVGAGAVSPAGWGRSALSGAVERGSALATTELQRPGGGKPFLVRPVPPPSVRPAFLAHPRMRRADVISQHAVAAAFEAMGEDLALAQSGALRVGVIVATMAGCVTYSRRYYEEVLRDPGLASPMVFPETVFNAPASHLSAILGSTEPSCTLVGDNGTFLQGLALGADWLTDGRVDACIVVGAEELDWAVADAARLFHRKVVQAAGAGAVYLRRVDSIGAGSGARLPVILQSVTDSFIFTARQSPEKAASKMRSQLPASGGGATLFDSMVHIPKLDAPEKAAWSDWSGPRFSAKLVLGEAFNAASAWQCAAAFDWLQTGGHSSAIVSVVGVNQQAIGACFSNF